MGAIKINWKSCDFWNLTDELGWGNNNMYYYFKRVAEKQGADIDYCYIVELSHDDKWPKMNVDDDIYYNDDANDINIHWLYMGKYNDYILVYEP